MDFLEYFERVRAGWRRIPDQAKRLIVVIAVVIVVFVPVRARLVPGDFGEIGHYRASALQEIASLDIKYAGHQVCNDCHDDIVEYKSAGNHHNVNCEVCHGPAYVHAAADDPDEHLPRAPRGRGYCPLCHGYLASRPTGFPQIVADSHYPLKPCISCHDPHQPASNMRPTECEACHAEIARTKALSHHVYVECTFCHSVPEEHKVSPRRFRPTKPSTREFCGRCHGEGDESEDATKVDMDTHGEGYVCWQCHYPHLPEAH